MQEVLISLGQVYSALQQSGFEGKVFFKLWSEKFLDSLCVYESLNILQMKKIYLQLQAMLEQTNRLFIFQRHRLSNCIKDCELRYSCKKEMDKRKGKQRLRLKKNDREVPLQQSLVIFTTYNGQKYYSNPNLIERRFERVGQVTSENLDTNDEYNENSTEMSSLVIRKK